MTVDVRTLMGEARGGWVARGLLGPTSDSLRAMCRELGWRYMQVTLPEACDKKTLLRALARQLDLPEYFGHNWDALADCMWDVGDGSAGVVLRLKGLHAVPQGLATTLVDILNDRVKDGPRPFVVVTDPPLPSSATASPHTE